MPEHLAVEMEGVLLRGVARPAGHDVHQFCNLPVMLPCAYRPSVQSVGNKCTGGVCARLAAAAIEGRRLVVLDHHVDHLTCAQLETCLQGMQAETGCNGLLMIAEVQTCLGLRQLACRME